MSKEQNLEIARRFRETLWTSGDTATVGKIIAPDCVIHGRVPVATGFGAGPEAIRQLIAFYQFTFSDIHMTVDQTVAEGDLVTVRWSARGLHTGDLLGVPPTGREVATNGIDLLRITDGRVIEAWMTWDTIGLLWQLFDSGESENKPGPDLLAVIERLLG